ncbi:GNAT family N-acetyltransferase [Taklimakanibacter lacteus]|uniref:GNAT family N-acetyltransferase n=1 Tax=Taklimakanibacter lacteus TaxID=2268456 RepID=UPI000E673FDC
MNIAVTSRLTTRTLTSLAEMAEISEAWQALGERSFVPAGSCLASWLMPALQAYASRPAELLTVWRQDQLCGVFAMKAGGALKRSWASPLSFLGTPLIDQEEAPAVIAAFLEAQRGRPVLLGAIPASGPFWDMLSHALARAGGAIEVLERWERAGLAPKGSFEEWFTGNFERKRRKEYRRLRARLAEEGELQSISWAAGDPLDPWVDELMALEAQGWKGRRGTALADDAAMATAFRAALHLLAAEGSLRFWKIVFNGKPIAIMSGLVKGAQGWLGKIAYDEAFARYSPGVQLVLDATETLIDKERLALVDSCAIPNHPMINNIWRDRVALCDALIQAPGLSSTAFRLAHAAERGRRGARETAKTLYYRIMRRQKS